MQTGKWCLHSSCGNYDFHHSGYTEVISELQNDKIAMEQQLAAKDQRIKELELKVAAQKEHIEHQKNEIEWLKN